MRRLPFPLLLAVPSLAFGALGNSRYTVTVESQGSAPVIRIATRDARQWDLRPDFLILQAERDPKPALRPGTIPHAPYNVLTWESDLAGSSTLRATKHSETVAGDGFDNRILEGDTRRRTADVFHAGRTTALAASSVIERGGAIELQFAAQADFTLSAVLTVPPGDAAPQLRYVFTPNRAAYYSVGFVGAPEFSPASLEELWQPFIWQQKRFPDASYVTPAFECPVPATLVTREHASFGVVVDAAEFPFEPLPLLENSRFGVALRTATGSARPMVFAPLLGGVESKMAPGKNFTFTLRLFAAPGRTTDAFAGIARELYGFTDYRQNAICSANETLDNMIDYGLSRYSWFVDELKGCAYSTDVPGAVKNVSALNPLELALVADDEEIFQKRAYPIVEFLLSREKFLFSLDPKQKIQSPSRALEGPCAPVSELAALYGITHGASPVLRRFAEEASRKNRVLNLDDVAEGGTWQNALALYESTGEPSYLARARKGADEYLRTAVEQPATRFEGGGFFFWTGYAPKWIDLLRLYEATHEPRYLEAAHRGARLFSQFIWMAPAIPNETITVNRGGNAPVYWYLKSKGHQPMRTPEETVPAWRLSEIGLTPESSGTMSGHRAIFMANHAAWMLRIAALTNDSFLHDIARSAVVGRYRNFPGYHINTARTTITERADYPLHEHKELSVNSFHYNHIWPHLSLLLDFLVSDFVTRSGGQIDFPSRYIEGYAYLQSKFYGDRPGSFYGRNDARLWMPRRLLKSGSVELNYLAARGDGRLYLAFANQSAEAVTTEVALNPEVLPQAVQQEYELRFVGGAGTTARMQKGRFTVTVPARGLTAVVIEGLNVQPRFQQKLLAADAAQAWKQDYVEVPFGRTRAMILNFGPGAETAYVYLRDDDSKFREVSLTYTVGGEQSVLRDTSYPFEFTVPIPREAADFTFQLRAVTVGGATEESALAALRR